MARIFETKSDLREIQRLIQGSSSFVDIDTAITIAANELNLNARFAVHAFPWPDVKCLTLVVRNKFNRPWVAIKLLREEDKTFGDDLREHLKSLLESLLTEFSKIALFSTDELIKNLLSSLLPPNCTFAASYPSFTYEMKEEKQREVAKMNIQLPEGFNFYELDADKDAHFISSTWTHASEEEEMNTKSKIATLPSIGIKFGSKLVAFEMCFSDGTMNHLYTDHEFRGKGLGTAVELKLAQKLIALNITPHKLVEIDNPLALAFAEKSKYFTKVLSGTSNQPVLYVVHIVTKSENNF